MSYKKKSEFFSGGRTEDKAMSLLPYLICAAVLLAIAYWYISRAAARPFREDALRNRAYNRQYYGYDQD